MVRLHHHKWHAGNLWDPQAAQVEIVKICLVERRVS